jgi:hypothetical protein
MEPHIYLKDRSHYEERYDRTTIDIARIYDRNVCFDRKVLPAQGRRREMVFEAWMLHPSFHPFLLERADKREQTIAEWMKEDRKCDERFARAEEPRYLCPQCDRRMDRQGKFLDSMTEVVLFAMKCRDCKKRCIVDENGTPRRKRPIRCVKCKKEVKTTIEQRGEVFEFTDTCRHCGHIEVTTDEPAPQKTLEELEEESRLFAQDRDRYCWTPEQAATYRMNVEDFWKTIEYICSDRYAKVVKEREALAAERRKRKRK